MMRQKFEHKITEVAKEREVLRKKRRVIMLLRLLVFISAASGIYAIGVSPWSISVGGAGLVIFLFLVRSDGKLKALIERNGYQRAFFELELKALDLEDLPVDDGRRYKNGDHPYADDLDIFDERGLFRLLNRSGSEPGADVLASLLKDFETREEMIRERTDFVNRYKNESDIQSRFYASVKSADLSSERYRRIRAFLSRDQPVNLLHFLLPALFSIASLTVISFVAFGGLAELALLYTVIAGLTFTAILSRGSNPFFEHVTAVGEVFGDMRPALEEIADKDLSEQVTGIEKIADMNAMRRIIRQTDLTESRANLFAALTLNGLFLWNVYLIYSLSKSLNRHRVELLKLLEATVQFDGYNSLFAYAGRYPDRPNAELTDSGFEVCEAGHPLISEKARVNNDFSLKGDERFAVITGANMAGKSTFLRTLGINMVLASIGVPTVARIFRFKPVLPFTSMRTGDDLREGESYFFSELKRLKMIVEHLEKGEELFLILDEILKGTNSIDKAEGSKAFVEKLLKYEVRGVIATHDLSLCDMAKVHPDNIKNQNFEVEFTGGALHFDYKLRSGVCRNMNASYLLAEMGLVDKAESGTTENKSARN